MVKNRRELAELALKKAEQYLDSANDNMKKKRFFVASEDIFRAVETSLESLLYFFDVKKIEYPSKKEKFKGRLALQFLVRDVLVKPGRIGKDVFDKYLELASNLHYGSYSFKVVDENSLEGYFEFAENLIAKVKSIIKS
ncbi:MAG: hypothetical protein QXY45_04100 [Candidatus Aenigmatarchaeota archaeon]